MNISLGQLSARYSPEEIRQRHDQIERAFRQVLSIDTASPYALLVAPDQSVWKVTVDDAGALHTTKIPKGRPV